MVLPVRERQAIAKEMARRYVRAGKRERGLMLDELYAFAGYKRSYAARLLRDKVHAERPRRKRRRGRQPAYGPELIAPLAKVWATLGGICGKRPAAVMERTVSALERHGKLELTGAARGEFTDSLCVTDVASAWTEVRIVRNRARRWTFETLLDVRASLPVPLLGIDSTTAASSSTPTS